jgi:hypothetical protein
LLQLVLHQPVAQPVVAVEAVLLLLLLLLCGLSVLSNTQYHT